MGGGTTATPGGMPAVEVTQGKSLRSCKDQLVAAFSKAVDVLIDAETNNPIYAAQTATKISAEITVTYPAGQIKSHPSLDLTKDIDAQINAQPLARVTDNHKSKDDANAATPAPEATSALPAS
jgi:thioredoxin reductase